MKYIIDNIMSMYEIMLITEYWDSVNINPSMLYLEGIDSSTAGNFKINPVYQTFVESIK